MTSEASGDGALAAGPSSTARGDRSVALGSQARAYEDLGVAVGANAHASAARSVALGETATAGGEGSMALGGISGAAGTYAMAIGWNALALPDRSLALGAESEVAPGAENSVALGAGSYADRPNAVSVGTPARRHDAPPYPPIEAVDRQIIHVAAGTEDTDAVNLKQLKDAGLADVDGNPLQAVTYDGRGGGARITLAGEDGTTLANVAAGTQAGEAINVQQFRSLAATLGGGVSMGPNGIVSPPTYLIRGSSYFNVGDAFGAVDQALGKLDGRVSVLEQGGDATGKASAGSAQAATAKAAAPTRQVASTARTGEPAATDATAEGHPVAAIAGQPRQATVNAKSSTAAPAATAGVSAQTEDALVTARSYADSGDRSTLAEAQRYVDSKFATAITDTEFDAYRAQVDGRFHAVDRRMDRVGAMGTAMSQMTANTAGLSGANRIGVGAGSYGGESALSVGFQRAFNDNRASLSVGAAVSGSESTVGVGAGFSW
jgi:autotransporter adhesin